MDLTKSVTDCPPLLPSAGLRPQSGPRCWNWYIPMRGSFSPASLPRAHVFPSLPFRSILNYRLTNKRSPNAHLPASHAIFPFIYIARDRDIPRQIRSNELLSPFRAFIVQLFLSFPEAKKKKNKKRLVSPSWIQLKSASGFGP